MRPPLLVLAVAFGAGLAWGQAGPGESAGLVYVVAPVVAAALVGARRAPLGSAAGLMGVAGVLWGAAAVRERAATCAGRWAASDAGASRGVASATRAALVRLADPVPPAGGVVDAAVVPGPCGGPLRLRWPAGRPARGGTAWVVAGRWVGSAARGVLVARRLRELDPVPRGRGGLRDRVVTRVAALFGARAPLVDALVIARRADLDSAVRERYAHAGLAHLLAISGLHIGFLAAWLGVLLRLARPRPALEGAALLALLGGYVWLLGFPAPATRAAAMLLLDRAARLRQRVVTPRGTVALAALVVLVGDPWALRSVGAWLSVAAVGAVIWAGRACAGQPRALRLVAPALAATLATAPISAFAFGIVAPVGVLANLVAIPLAGLAVPGLVLALLLSWVAAPAAHLVAAGAGLVLALLDAVALGAARVPGGHLVMTAGWPAAGVWAAVAALAWWLWHSPRRPWLVAARVALAAAVAVAVWVRGALPLDACRCLTVFFLDVGQGDAAALRTPGGRWVVIDGGPRTLEGDAGRRVVLPFLRRAGVGRLAAVVATHGDADHLGGLPAVIDALDPELVLEPGEPLGRPLYLEFLAAVEASNARWHAARAGDRIELDGVTLEVLSPDSLWLATPLDVNDHGVVLRATFGAVRVLFQGDAGLPVEARLAGTVGPVELLKVGHHGSRTATGEAWLDELTPRAAVISVGRANRYGHPAPEVVARLARRGIAVLRTDQHGTITFSTDGHGVRIRSRHD